MSGALKRVLVRPPLPEDVAGWRAAGWRAEPDPTVAAHEHEAFCLLLEEAGCEVIVSEHDRGNPDALYPYDPVLVGRDGAVLLRPGKRGGAASRARSPRRSRPRGCLSPQRSRSPRS